jgi:type I restriction enzyme S subunit
MTAVEQLIIDHLDLWAAAVKRKSAAGRGASSKIDLYGIKKLRELILELAIRGLLVPQNLKDESASELLKKIAAEKAKLVREGKIKKVKSLPSTSKHGSDAEVPSGWIWTCMAALGEIAPKNEIDDDVIASFVPMPLISTRFDGRHERDPKTWAEIKKGYTHFADGDVAIAKITPCFENSKAAIFSGLHNGVGAGTTELHVVRPFGEFVSRNYLLLYLKSPQFLRVGETKMTGSAGQKRVPTEFFAFNPLPLPPLAEQHRIVAKVDDLMALCDRLEQQIDSSLSSHQTLVETLLQMLISAADHAQFASAWQRAVGHFDTLFTTEESIDQLKQAILQLAVMGKLVPQDPNNEPASELLNRITSEKAKLVKDGKIKKEKPLSLINKKDEPYGLPKGWAWARIGNATLFSEYGISAKTFEMEDGIPVLKMGDIQDGKVLLGGQKKAGRDFEGIDELMLEDGDLLYNRTNSAELVGKTGIFRGPSNLYSFASYLLRIRCSGSALTPDFLNASMNSSLFRKTQIEPHLKQQCGQANVNGTIMKNMIVPIAPIEEQKRIIAKLEELFGICDSLKNLLNRTQTIQLYLADALTEKALART